MEKKWVQYTVQAKQRKLKDLILYSDFLKCSEAVSGGRHNPG